MFFFTKHTSIAAAFYWPPSKRKIPHNKPRKCQSLGSKKRFFMPPLPRTQQACLTYQHVTHSVSQSVDSFFFLYVVIFAFLCKSHPSVPPQNPFWVMGVQGITARAQIPEPEPACAPGTASYGLANPSAGTASRSNEPPDSDHRCWTLAAGGGGEVQWEIWILKSETIYIPVKSILFSFPGRLRLSLVSEFSSCFPPCFWL